MNPLIETYLKKIDADFQSGKSTEHTYRPALKDLLEALAPGVTAANDPKHIACGAPDFIVERGAVPLGYVETKDIGADLDKAEKSPQLHRYRQALHNLILTDYLEFRWYVNGQPKLTARLAAVGKDSRLIRSEAGSASVAQLLAEFYQTAVPTVVSPSELAERMAQLTQLVRDLTHNALQEETESGALHRQYQAFRAFLLPNLKPREFADIYAQTMAYGLFAARVNAPDAEAAGNFTRAAAYQHLASNRFLRRLFLDVGDELDATPIAPFLDDIVVLLARADMGEILRDFGRRTRTEDPVVHFYETFLAAYDPKLRESRGVYYTPEPVVQFIVHSVDWLLRERFQRPQGLAAPDVQILDPATGTGTFLYYVVRVIHETLQRKGQAGAWQEYVHQALLPRMFGFELLVAPYVIAHLKLGLLLRDLDYAWGKDDRLRVFLTNTLDAGVARAELLEGLNWYISQEANEAAEVKKNTPIMVVLGNPPYSANSANTGAWISHLVRESYYPHDAIKEQNPKLLLDDYVKFIRFAQWRIAQTGYGIVAFITNHGYVDNPTFREMRQHLLQTFDELYVLDLHGNSKKKERAPDGGKDENIFDIQQGVAILLAVKRPPADSANQAAGPAHVYHAHLWGPRQAKYTFLAGHDITSTAWTELQPTAPFYLFTPQNTSARAEYEQGWKVTDIFPVNATGLKTHRDHFALDFDRAALEKRIRDFRNLTLDDAAIRQKYDLPDTRDWKLHPRRISLSKVKDWQQYIMPCLYRPFDVRMIYYHSDVLERPRLQVMSHLLKENLGLIIPRQITSLDFTHALCTRSPIEMKTCSHDRGTNVFPLYLYPNGELPTTLFDHDNGRRPNLANDFVAAFATCLKLTFIPDGAGDLTTTCGPEDLFHYAYAVFHSPTYRARYAEFLKVDFPRLPLTSDLALFAALVAQGAQLVDLHLLRSPALDDFITTYPAAGDNVVEKVRYAPENVWINAQQYFGGVPEAVWELRIGGYQVCEKWLKDRKGRALSHADLTHYQRMIVAFHKTLRLMAEIDAVIPAWPLP